METCHSTVPSPTVIDVCLFKEELFVAWWLDVQHAHLHPAIPSSNSAKLFFLTVPNCR